MEFDSGNALTHDIAVGTVNSSAPILEDFYAPWIVSGISVNMISIRSDIELVIVWYRFNGIGVFLMEFDIGMPQHMTLEWVKWMHQNIL